MAWDCTLVMIISDSNVHIEEMHLNHIVFIQSLTCIAQTVFHYWVILQELPNSCPQTLMSHYGFRFRNFSKILCGLCRAICMCIFTILKLVISLKAKKRFWFYSGKVSLFHVSQFWIFVIQSCIEVT